ncbi:MAG: DUF3034 family protein [Gammaproteobacteria bacterium]|nr:DUF3034 family protein [Gammaproteobacteria bacterium]
MAGRLLGAVLLLLAGAASAEMPRLPHNSRILATGGATMIEGAAGGGIVPWAVLAGYGSSDEVGASGFYTHVDLKDYSLDAFGVAASWHNRVEVSLARQAFDLGTLGRALGLDDHELRQNILGVKLRLSGDLIYGRWPQVAAGMQYKHNLDFGIPDAVGARHDDDVELYISAAKLWLAGLFERNVFGNLTLRWSRANQGGLLGFGGDRGDGRELLVEGAAGIFLTRHIALGGEYRQQPDKLSFSPQSDWFDAFVAVFPNKHLSLVAAYADLGTVATLPGQRGWYLSLQLAF